MTPFSKAPALVQIVLFLLVAEALVLAAVFSHYFLNYSRDNFKVFMQKCFYWFLQRLPLFGFCTFPEDY
jgi:predicted membrane-bound mannosyltransferase